MADLPQPYDSLVQPITALCSAMIALTTVVVLARFWVRLSLVKARLETHDWCILAAWAFAVTSASVFVYQTGFRVDEHVWDVTSEVPALKEYMTLIYVQSLTYIVCVAATKVAVLLLYLRIAAQKLHRVLIWTWIVFVSAFAFVCIIVIILQRIPISKAWDPIGNTSGHCINGNAFIFAHAGLDIFQDVVVYSLPMKMLYALHVPLRQKIALVLIFALGGFVIITGMIRLGYLKTAPNTAAPFYTVIWSNVQCSVGVVCASLPHFKPFIDRYFPGLIGGRPSKVTPLSEGSTKRPVCMSTKQSHVNQPASMEFRLEHPDTVGTAHSSDEGYDYSITTGGHPRFGLSSSEEHLRVPEARYCEDRICKTTTVTVAMKPRAEITQDFG